MKFNFFRGIASIVMPTFSNKELKKIPNYHTLSDSERLHNDYRKSTLAIKEEADKFDRKYAR